MAIQGGGTVHPLHMQRAIQRLLCVAVFRGVLSRWEHRRASTRYDGLLYASKMRVSCLQVGNGKGPGSPGCDAERVVSPSSRKEQKEKRPRWFIAHSPQQAAKVSYSALSFSQVTQREPAQSLERKKAPSRSAKERKFITGVQELSLPSAGPMKR